MLQHRGRGGRVAVTVHFKNGGHATIGHAVTVEAEAVPTGDPAATGNDGIVLKDSDDKVVGRFFQAEIVGYFIHEASGRSGFH
jgi:hypothetical protein